MILPRLAAVLIFRRLAATGLVTIVASLLLLLAFAAAPGDPASAVLGQHAAGREAAQWDLATASPWERLGRIAAGAARGDFAVSLHYDDAPVIDIVLEGLPATLILSLAALALAVPPGVGLGLAAAALGGRASAASAVLFTVCVSAPSAALAAGLIYWLGLSWRLLPTAGWGDAASAVAPILTLAVPAAGHIGRTTWALAAEIMPLPYVRAARAKGLSRLRVARSHVSRNIAAPLLAFLAAVFSNLLGGTVLVESLFAIPGLGRETVTAMLTRDYPVALGCMLALIGLNALVGIIADLAAGLADPRGDGAAWRAEGAG